MLLLWEVASRGPGSQPRSQVLGTLCSQASPRIFWHNAQAGKDIGLVPVPAVSLGQDVEGGEAGSPLAKTLSQPPASSHSSLSSSVQNILPAKELKGESHLWGLGLFVTLKVWSSSNLFAEKALANFGNTLSSREHRGVILGPETDSKPPSYITGWQSLSCTQQDKPKSCGP